MYKRQVWDSEHEFEITHKTKQTEEQSQIKEHTLKKRSKGKGKNFALIKQPELLANPEPQKKSRHLRRSLLVSKDLSFDVNESVDEVILPKSQRRVKEKENKKDNKSEELSSSLQLKNFSPIIKARDDNHAKAMRESRERVNKRIKERDIQFEKHNVKAMQTIEFKRRENALLARQTFAVGLKIVQRKPKNDI